ncbi:MAG: T9SS type A sorting domain-containing protein [Candidatus Coatesbacteria bacterium]|nr:T9SS type A sorting domain-containing protein [Candidatus Coatesbacteria bacterium]
MLEWDYNDRADYIHHNNGFINIVWREGDDLWYMHNQVGLDAPEADLRARPADEGLLLTWREAGELTGANWDLMRDGAVLAELSGETDYAYLDRNVDPGVTYSYTLTATQPDGEILTFGPVEATWPGADRSTPALAEPYPSPAGDSVTLSYTLPSDTTSASITIYDLSGRRIAEEALDPAPGRNSLTLPTDTYPPGAYLVELTTNTTSTTRRFVIGS